MTGSVMAGVDTEEKLEREDKIIFFLAFFFLLQTYSFSKAKNSICLALLSLIFISAHLREAEQREKFRRKREAMKARQKKRKVQ